MSRGVAVGVVVMGRASVEEERMDIVMSAAMEKRATSFDIFAWNWVLKMNAVKPWRMPVLLGVL